MYSLYVSFFLKKLCNQRLETSPFYQHTIRMRAHTHEGFVNLQVCVTNPDMIRLRAGYFSLVTHSIMLMRNSLTYPREGY